MNRKLYDRICSVTDKFVSEIQFHATHKDALEGMGFTVGDNIHDYPSIPENYNHYCIVDYKFHEATRQVAGWGNSDREALGMCIREIEAEFEKEAANVIKPLALADKFLAEA